MSDNDAQQEHMLGIITGFGQFCGQDLATNGFSESC